MPPVYVGKDKSLPLELMIRDITWADYCLARKYKANVELVDSKFLVFENVVQAQGCDVI
jgi:hypothetical protein